VKRAEMTDPVADLVWAARSSSHTVRASYEIARAAIAAGVPGDFVECGVFAGSNAAAMARAILLDGPGSFRRRKVHLFDTFTGCPAPGPADKGWSHEAGVSACSREQMLGYMDTWGIPRELLVIHEGPFALTVAEAIRGRDFEHFKIAVLRLDADLYQSTKEALALYDLVSPGGWVIVDDWDLPGCKQAVMERIGGGFGPIYWVKNV
jgi:O-methyltransferase